MIISDVIGIIADDLTDANDAALQFHLRGANSQILLNFECSPQHVKNAQVWAVSTATRNKSPEVAREEVAKVTQQFLDTINPEYFFKKINSSLTGNIATETLAILNVLKWDLAIIIPACPIKNKITVGGYQLVNGQPIERTECARENFISISESYVPYLLQKQLNEEDSNKIALLDLQTIMKGAGPILQKLKMFAASDKKLIVADTVSITDIEQIILAVKKSDLKILPAGTSATAQVLGKFWLPLIEKDDDKKCIPDLPKLIISGTATNITMNQLEQLEKSEAFDNIFFENLDMQTVLHGVEDDFVDRIIKKLDSNNVVVVHSSDLIKNFDGFSDDSLNTDMTKTKLIEHILAYLAELTKEVVDKKEVILITLGGDTSYKCCCAINSMQLQIIDEVENSVALTLDHKSQWIVSKSGHIGDKFAIIDILKYFHKLSCEF
ncbi:four-carbon acid sugar kinase family protein [bacterium]|nr:four-carbon acid sugar kinase family protein [bacterium]